MSEFTASGIDEVDELSSLPHLKPGDLCYPFDLVLAGMQSTWKIHETCLRLSGYCMHDQQGKHFISLGLQCRGCIHAGVFTTKSQYKKAHKKRDKLARRAGRVTSGAKPGQQSRLGPESPATPMVMEASFAFGSFEQHTTGQSRHCLVGDNSESWSWQCCALSAAEYFAQVQCAAGLSLARG